MTQPARGSERYVGFAPSDTRFVPKEPTKWIDALDCSLLPNVDQIQRGSLRPGTYQVAESLLPGGRSVKGGVKTEFHPEAGIELLAAILPATAHDQQGGTAAYKHTLKGADSVPCAEGFTIFEGQDITGRNFYGCYPTKVSMDFEIGKAVQLNYDMIGKDVVSGKGTAGTSQGQSAISFPVTLVVSTSDQIKLAVDGGSAVEITIAAGVYSTAAALTTAVNAAIRAAAGLLVASGDRMGDPKVGAFVNSANKINFYSATKGASSSVAWTDGTHDASTLLGQGTQVEAAGAATLPTPTFPTILPFIYHQGSLLIGGVEVDVEKFSLVIDLGLQEKSTLGHASLMDVLLSKKRVVSGSFDKWFEDEAINTAFRGLATAALKIQLRTGVAVATGYNYDCDIYLNNIRYGNPFPKASGSGPFKQGVPFTSYYDPTYGDIQVEITNSLATW